MTKRNNYTIYATDKAVEIIPSAKEQKDGAGNVTSREGRVSLKFFEFDKLKGTKGAEVYFAMDVVEANHLGRKIQEILSGKTQKYSTNPHKFTRFGGQETTTSVVAEKWGTPERGGYALQVYQDTAAAGSNPATKVRINVAMNEAGFAFAGDYLQHLAMEQCYNEWLGGAAASGGKA